MVDITNVTPTRNLVIVKVTNIESTVDGLIAPDHSDETDIATRNGEVVAIGPEVDSEEHCLGLQPGDKVIFTEYAGHYIASADTASLYKVLRGYDIIGKHMKEDDISNKDSAIPTGNRILIELIDFTNPEDGIIIDVKDPKLVDLSYGKVIKVNDSINKLNLSVDQLVAFAPYVGTLIRNYESEDKQALIIIVEDDILFTI